MNTVRIVNGLLDARIYSPFEAKDVIKSMPVRAWDKTARCWRIPSPDVPLLQGALHQAGFTTFVTSDKSTRTEPPKSETRADTWADRMFAELDPPLADKAFKALLRVLHPDTGGSTTAMQQLNRARDKAGITR